MENLKRCTKCGEEKELDKFYKRKINKDGLYGECKKCHYKRNRIWRKNNSDKIKGYTKKYYQNDIKKRRIYGKKYYYDNLEKSKKNNKEWRKNNPEKVRKNRINWARNNPERVKELQKIWIKNNPEKNKKRYKKYYKKNIKKIKESYKKYYQNNKKKIKEINKRWHINNLNRINKWNNKYRNNKRKTDIHFKIKCNISRAINHKLKRRLLSKNGKSTFSFLPYTVDELKQHLESLFQPWMNWQNYGNKAGMWCIDHRHPDSLFNYTSVEDEEFQKCWALENLQPMEFIENIKKSDKLIYE